MWSILSLKRTTSTLLLLLLNDDCHISVHVFIFLILIPCCSADDHYHWHSIPGTLFYFCYVCALEYSYQRLSISVTFSTWLIGQRKRKKSLAIRYQLFIPLKKKEEDIRFKVQPKKAKIWISLVLRAPRFCLWDLFLVKGLFFYLQKIHQGRYSIFYVLTNLLGIPPACLTVMHVDITSVAHWWICPTLSIR